MILNAHAHPVLRENAVKQKLKYARLTHVRMACALIDYSAINAYVIRDGLVLLVKSTLMIVQVTRVETMENVQTW